MKKKHTKQEYIKRKSLEGGIQFDRSGKRNKEDTLTKNQTFFVSVGLIEGA